jgi:ribonuclease VapC
MFLDASAVVAIIAREEDARPLQRKIVIAAQRSTSPIAIYESIMGVARALNLPLGEAKSLVNDFLRETQAQIISIDSEIGASAMEACERFGKGRHPAKLNMGDCFAYACAKQLGVPLLFKGDDFAKTDIEVA